MFPSFPSKAKRTFVSTRDKVFDLIQKIVDQRIQDHQKDVRHIISLFSFFKELENCYLKTMITLSEGHDIYPDTLRNHIYGILGAAHTNTAAIITWACVRLLSDPELR
jgi:cytochrome P450